MVCFDFSLMQVMGFLLVMKLMKRVEKYVSKKVLITELFVYDLGNHIFQCLLQTKLYISIALLYSEHSLILMLLFWLQHVPQKLWTYCVSLLVVPLKLCFFLSMVNIWSFSFGAFWLIFIIIIILCDICQRASFWTVTCLWSACFWTTILK